MSAPQPRGASGVTYTHAAEGYFDKRGLTRTAGFWGLWGLGVAAVISGDFSGWNFGIGGAGWGGFLIATVIVTLMYVTMIGSIGEMSAAMPHTGGAYSFARSAMGPWGGFVTGLAETIEYVATTAVIVYFSASYADSITDELFGLSMPAWVWWVILYAVFLLLNIAGAEVSFRFAVVVAALSLAVIALFAVMALFSGALDFGKLFDIEPDAGNSTFVPFGWWQVVLAMPFAMWLYLGIEELPLAAEESHMPARDIPRAGMWGLATLIVSGGLVLLLNPAVVGASAIGESGEPLLDGFRAILPNSDVAAILSAFALIGLFASLQGIMYAYGRNIYSLSRAGYYPKVAVADRHPQDAVDRPRGRRGHRHRRAGPRRHRRRDGRRDRPQHRRLGRGPGLPAADGVVRAAAPEVPERQPARTAARSASPVPCSPAPSRR